MEERMNTVTATIVTKFSFTTLKNVYLQFFVMLAKKYKSYYHQSSIY